MPRMPTAAPAPMMTGPGSPEFDEDDSWAHVAGDEITEQRALNDQIVEVGSAGGSDEAAAAEDADLQESVTYSSVRERVERFRAVRASWSSVAGLRDGSTDDPYWLGPFMNIIECLDGPQHVNNFQKHLTVLSGCTGMCAEAFVLQAGASRFKVYKKHRIIEWHMPHAISDIHICHMPTAY